jgi:acetyl esterase/lipase
LKRKGVILKGVYKWAGILFLCTDLFACAGSQNDYTKSENIHYAKAYKQTIDIYVPNKKIKQKRPVLIYVHGGGWTGGDKSKVGAKLAFFTENGYVFVSVSYRLFPNAQYNDMGYDVAKAIEWVADHANKYNIDASKINVMGHSAGGHLTTLVATDTKYLQSVNLTSKALNSIVILDGPTNIKQFVEAIPSYKKVFGTDEKVWTEASPLTYIRNKDLPPAFMVTRWHNPAVYEFAEALNKEKGEKFVYEVKTLSHSNLNKMFGSPDAPQEAQDMTKAVMAFLKQRNQ